MRWTKQVARVGELRNSHRVSYSMGEGNKTFGRRRNRWIGNTKMNLKGIGHEDANS